MLATVKMETRWSPSWLFDMVQILMEPMYGCCIARDFRSPLDSSPVFATAQRKHSPPLLHSLRLRRHARYLFDLERGRSQYPQRWGNELPSRALITAHVFAHRFTGYDNITLFDHQVRKSVV